MPLLPSDVLKLAPKSFRPSLYSVKYRPLAAAVRSAIWRAPAIAAWICGLCSVAISTGVRVAGASEDFTIIWKIAAACGAACAGGMPPRMNAAVSGPVRLVSIAVVGVRALMTGERLL